jgi:hypothetical protein
MIQAREDGATCAANPKRQLPNAKEIQTAGISETD